ncbi:hypothetical protein BpHYR1_029026 [Brachionus plicatilis]|uniref:Uncharacterized protein n=1 Tax=Brachionus plicatilis TaxID=10195 RepID=A0A3M7SWK3_BRAPC|nr:hypothetical protein BpHYR1_029026 [Brachionus plicatilis]
MSQIAIQSGELTKIDSLILYLLFFLSQYYIPVNFTSSNRGALARSVKCLILSKFQVCKLLFSDKHNNCYRPTYSSLSVSNFHLCLPHNFVGFAFKLGMMKISKEKEKVVILNGNKIIYCNTSCISGSVLSSFIVTLFNPELKLFIFFIIFREDYERRHFNKFLPFKKFLFY